jgi:outer membrane protein OmpA-like peptidoglycan-associated protein
MKLNALTLALATATLAVPGSAQAADDLCSRVFLYAVNQICQLLPNGQSLCQPVALAGPSPTCDTPGQQNMVQVPIGPPTLQFPQFPQFMPGTGAYAPNPFAGNPFVGNPFADNPFVPNPFAGNPFAGTPFAPPSGNASPYAPSAFPPVMPQFIPPVVMQPSTQPTPWNPSPAAVISPAVAAQAPAADTTPLVKLMPETPIAAATEAPVAPLAAVSAPPVTTPVTAAPEVTTKPEAASVNATHVATPVAAPAPEAAPIGAMATAVAPPAVSPEATASAEAARLAEEKALADALAHFEFDSAELTPLGRSMLDGWLTQASSSVPILVTGHADRLGPEPYNEKLSQLRAEAVKKYLVDKGMPAKRIQIVAKGEHMPLISCAGDANPETKSCLAPNRRAEVAAKPAAKATAKTSAKPVAKSAAKSKPKSKK